MAGAGAKLFTSGSVLTADQVNTFLMDQSIMRFASNSARDAAFGGAGEPTLAEGMFAYTTDSNALWFYTGSAWQNVLGSNIGETSTSNRNGVINGGMSVWQRGTSVATTGASASFGADRFQIYRNTTGATLSRQTTSDTTNLPQIQYCSRIQRTAATSSTAGIFLSYSFESADSIRFVNRTAVISFYARAGANYSAASGALGCSLRSGTGTDQNNLDGFTGFATVVGGDSTLTTTWQRFQLTGTVASTATQLGITFTFTPVGTAGADDYFEITGVQVETGSLATPFEFEDISTTLAKCQRYYYQHVSGSASIANGTVWSSRYIWFPLNFPVTMRVAPTLRISTGAGYYTVYYNSTTKTYSTMIVEGAGTNTAELLIDDATSPFTAGQSAFMRSSDASAGIGFQSEL
jgi:hypothetical protein